MRQGKSGSRLNTVNKEEIKLVKSAMTWGHKITILGIALAAVLMIAGYVGILAFPDRADALITYVQEWMPFFVSVVLGYSAKTMVENAMKIRNVMCGNGAESNG